jgi:dethiobiotin synthetase
MSPLRLRAPLAPTMAARVEGVSLTLDDLLRPCVAALKTGAGPLLIEGAGGVMSPMAEGATCLDLIAALRLPTLLVTGTYLGAISHTLTAYASMQAAGCAPCVIAVNESAGSEVILADALAELSAFLPRVPLAPVRRGEDDFSALAALTLISSNKKSISARRLDTSEHNHQKD